MLHLSELVDRPAQPHQTGADNPRLHARAAKELEANLGVPGGQPHGRRFGGMLHLGVSRYGRELVGG